MSIVFRSAYDEPVYPEYVPGESMTTQAGKEDADINVIVGRFIKSGTTPQMLPAAFADLSDVGSFQEMQQRLVDAKQAFMSLPSDIRHRFGHDPASFADFAINPANLDQMIAWGMAPKKQAPPVESPKESTEDKG